jgi:hypothetical protein
VQSPFACVLKFDSPLPEDHRVNILSTADADNNNNNNNVRPAEDM